MAMREMILHGKKIVLAAENPILMLTYREGV